MTTNMTARLRLALAGTALCVAVLLVACGGDEGGASAEGGGADGNGTPVTPAPTTTPIVPDGPGVTTDPATGGVSPPQPGPPGAPAFDEPPATQASAGGQTVEAGIGTYCWTMLCVDKIGVPTRGSLAISTGDVVTMAIPEDVPALREAAANVFPAVDAQRLEDGSEIWPYPGSSGELLPYEVGANSVDVTVNLQPGTYVLAVSLYFEAGDVVYGVLVNVQ